MYIVDVLKRNRITPKVVMIMSAVPGPIFLGLWDMNHAFPRNHET